MDRYVSQEVADALAQGRPVVALESTIITHGLPRPRNLDVALAAEEVLRGHGVTPATVGVLRGRVTVGLSADELRAASDTTGADKFDSLAKLALSRQISFENQCQTFDTQISQQTALVDQLKDGLNKMRVRRDELVQKRDELVARAKMAKAQTQVQTTLKNASIMDPTSELSHYEDKVRRQEAMAQGMAEVNADSVDEQFASLQGQEDSAEVEARLAALKAK